MIDSDLMTFSGYEEIKSSSQNEVEALNQRNNTRICREKGLASEAMAHQSAPGPHARGSKSEMHLSDLESFPLKYLCCSLMTSFRSYTVDNLAQNRKSSAHDHDSVLLTGH